MKSARASRKVVVVFSLEPWDDVWRRNQHLVSRLLTMDDALEVLFVEPSADPLHALLHGRRPRLGGGERRATGPGHAGDPLARLRLYQPTKWLPRRLDPHGDRRRAGAALRVAARRGAPVASWVNDLSAVHVLDLIDVPVLYDITDDWLAAQRSATENARLSASEHRLLAESTAVTACSPALVRDKGRARSDVVLLTNGVDLTAYTGPTERPSDLGTGPTALYVGTLHADRLDVDLCVRTARRLGDVGAHLVLLGPDALEPHERDQLARAGAQLLGPRPHAQVPDYVRGADVLVVPHVVDRFTDSLDPLKLYEYRAARRPVVSTPVAGFRDTDDDLVRVVEAVVFPEAVVGATTAGDVASHRMPADLPSWDTQAALMRETLDRLVQQPAARPR